MGLYMKEYNLLIVAATPSKHLYTYIVLGAMNVGYLMGNDYNEKIEAIHNLRKYTVCTVKEMQIFVYNQLYTTSFLRSFCS